MKKLMVVALIAMAIAGCGDSSKPTSTKWIGGSVVDQPEFRLPGSTFGLKSAQDSKAQSGRAWFFEKANWKPKGWSLWVASNVYSDYKAPKNDLSMLQHGFTRADSAAERSKKESFFIGGVSKWLKENHVDVELNFLGYDGLPESLMQSNDSYKGFWLTWNNEPCEKAFRMCVDNYFVSPVSRLSGGERLSYKDWIKPYLNLGEGDTAVGRKFVIDSWGGMEDENSPFYDIWPTMVFLVNPDGVVTRAWLPQKNDAATVQRVQAAIVADVGGPYGKVAVSDKADSARPPTQGYYGQHYIETGVGKVLETFQEILNSK